MSTSNDPLVTSNGNMVSQGWTSLLRGGQQLFVSTEFSQIMGNISNPEEPDYRDPLLSLMLLNSEEGYTLKEGIRGLRKAERRFTPQFAGETNEKYMERLYNRSSLTNQFMAAIEQHTNRIFSDPLQLLKIDESFDLPVEIEEVFENVTKTGMSFDTFAKELYKDSKIAGVSYIFLDSPPRTENETAGNLLQNRAYFRHLTIQDILGFEFEIVNGIERIVGFRYKYYTKMKTPKSGKYGFEQVLTVREIRPFEEILHYKIDGNWRFDKIQTELDQVFIFPFYTNKVGAMFAKPPLDNLALTNIAHWNMSIDHDNIIHFTQCPILEIKGDSPPEKIDTAAATAFWVGKEGSIRYVEAICNSINAGSTRLQQLELQMESEANKALTRPEKYVTATSVAAAVSSGQSQLETEAEELQKVLNIAFRYLLDISGFIDLSRNYDWKIKVNKEIGAETAFSEAKIQYLDKARERGDISWKTYAIRMRELGAFPDEIDFDKEKEALETERIRRAQLKLEEQQQIATIKNNTKPREAISQQRNLT